MANDQKAYPTQPSVNPSLVNDGLQQSTVYPLLNPEFNVSPPPPPYSDVAPPVVHQQQLLSQPPVTVQPSYQHTTVVLQSIQRPTFFPAEPINIQCWYCQQNIRTKTTGHSTCLTWLLCGVLCGLGCFCGCCLIPFCTNGTRDIVHSCPKCGKYLGTRMRQR